MAVKERKQITGTTAQINAYKGHEGQIVWDKEKKTLVGMSGTAGKNYPLAPKTYVDNEVAKVTAEVAKKASSAELTQGLAGKEDKGTCLPLTGGELTGALHLKNGGQLYQDKDNPNNYGYTVLTSKGDGTALNSCVLYLANPDSLDKGTIILRYIDESGVNRELFMNGDTDEFFWNRRPVETISGSGDSYIRYSNGLQICWGWRDAKFNLVPWGALYEARVTDFITFPVPFMSNPIVTTTANNNFTPQQGVSVNSTGITDIWFWFAAGIQDRVASTGYIAIGRWK